MRSHTRLILVVAAFALLVPMSWFGFASAQQDGSSAGGIGGRPANPRDDNPRSESIFIHTIEPGTSVTDAIKVINNSDETRTIDVYATDSVPSSGGAFACAQQVDPKEGVGSWITLSANRVEVPSTDTLDVPFTIQVPANTDVGEHEGCVVVQEQRPPAENTEGIGLSFRTAIRVAILVPGDINKSLTINNLATEIQSDKVVLTPSIANNGNVSVDADITTSIDLFFGMNASQEGGTFPVLRGQTGEWNFDHPRPFWGGFYKAEVEATYDANPDNFIGDANTQLRTVTYPAVWLFVMPHPLGLAIEILVLLALILAVWRLAKRVKGKRAVRKTWSTHKIKRGEDIRSLAKSHNISWKQLARANKIKAPYTLEVGQTIRVPKKISAKKAAKPKKIDVTK